MREDELGKMGYRKVRSVIPDAVEGEGGTGRMGDREVKSDTPDLRIAYSVIAEQKSRIDDAYGYGSYGHGS